MDEFTALDHEEQFVIINALPPRMKRGFEKGHRLLRSIYRFSDDDLQTSYFVHTENEIRNTCGCAILVYVKSTSEWLCANPANIVVTAMLDDLSTLAHEVEDNGLDVSKFFEGE